MTTTVRPPVLEPAAQAFADATAAPPFLHQVPPSEGRATVDAVQSPEIEVPGTTVEVIDIGRGLTVDVFRPTGVTTALPVVLYTHGAGWVFGNSHTHGRLARELALGAQSAVVFVNDSLSPEARYPVALEQVHAAASWAVEQGERHGLDGARIAVAGDSVGGNMTAALTLLTRQRNGPAFAAQVLFYPVTDATLARHRLLRAVLGGLLPHSPGDGVVLGPVHDRPRPACRDDRLPPPCTGRAAGRAPAGTGHHRRGRRPARRGRGLRRSAP